ncbi:MAG: divalent-cation tolerance protein CutA [Acidobacteria bacterium]|nr:divalent-cation tolerance protein CutA [Acidobacteriota bacterium]
MTLHRSVHYRGEMTEDGSEAVVAWTTWPAGGDVRGFARVLVEERLAACVTAHLPVRSVYRWQGAIEEDQEQLVMIKTTRDCIAALRDRMGELHPAEVPELVVVPVVDGNPAYLAWVAESTRDA